MLDPTIGMVPRLSGDPGTSGVDGDADACRNVLTYFFRLADSAQFAALDGLVTNDFSLELQPAGTVRTGLAEFIAFAKDAQAGDWLTRMHINHSLLFDRIGPDVMSATAICFRYTIRTHLDVPAPDGVSNARYTFRRDSGGPWRLARREHYRMLVPQGDQPSPQQEVR